MPLVDIYNIENWNGEEPTWIAQVLAGSFTTVLGVALGYLPGYVRDKKRITKSGKRFKGEITSLLLHLKAQVEDLDRCITEYTARTIGKKVEPPALHLSGRFRYIDSLDKTDLIDYY